MRKMPLQKEIEGLAGAQSQVQLGPMERAQMFLMVNDRGHIGYPAARSPRKEREHYVNGQLGLAGIYDFQFCMGRDNRYSDEINRSPASGRRQ